MPNSREFPGIPEREFPVALAQIGLFRLPLLYLTPPAEGFPCADLRESLHGPPQMPNVHNRVKYCRKV